LPAIANLSNSATSGTGAVLFIFGLFAGLYWFKGRR